MEPFAFYQIVKVETDDQAYSEINGLKGGITGRGQFPDGRWSYNVWFHDLERGFSVPHGYLVPTGECGQRSDFFADESVTIVVDPKTGEGRLKDKN